MLWGGVIFEPLTREYGGYIFDCDGTLADSMVVHHRAWLSALAAHGATFDFDWELLIKLIRRGYKPIEIPITYTSRSFEQGKKITMFRDPLTWMWALVKYRVCRL